VSPLITVKNLKLKVEKDFDIPVTVQRWILNNQLASDDSKTLLDFGVRENKSVIYLYILAASDDKKLEPKELNKVDNKPKNVFSELEVNILNISDSDNDDEQNEMLEETGAAALPTRVIKENGVAGAGWKCSICTLLNPFHRPDCMACLKPRPGDLNGLDDFKDDFPEELKRFLEEDNSYTAIIKTREPKNDLNRITTNRKSTDIFNIPFVDVEKKKSTTKSETEMPSALDRTTNSMDTLASTSKLRPQAEQKLIVATAFTSSPNITRSKYRGVYNFNPSTKSYELSKAVENRNSPEHTPIIKSAVLKTTAEPSLVVKPVFSQAPKKVNLPQHRTRPDKRPAPKPPTAAQKSHYLELLNLDNSDAVKNFEPFECPVCFLDYNVGQGVILRDCLHTFCRECLGNTVQYSDDPVIKCPYMDSDYSCDSVLQEREIKSLVSREVYDQHLAKSVRQAEHEIQNTFHCKTPNCDNWCIYEDNVNQFKCPVCKIVNCLLCRVRDCDLEATETCLLMSVLFNFP
jgi:RanBP-type and C3HC4-type zinc finger-containing protein 1